MAADFDNFPTYDPLIKAGTLNMMSGIWSDFMATFMQTLQGYLSQNGIFVPQLTTTQRDALRNVIAGQLIYNTTLAKFQGYEGSTLAWVNLV